MDGWMDGWMDGCVGGRGGGFSLPHDLAYFSRSDSTAKL